MNNAIRILAFALAVLLSFSQMMRADELVNARPGGVAVKGYDVVAYFTKGEAVPGKETIEHTWRDVRWRFASEQHRAIFEADPERYAPRYGGFCAGGVSLGRRSPVDPEAFVIVDGKLYLNFDKPTAEELRASPEIILPKADTNWKRMNEDNAG